VFFFSIFSDPTDLRTGMSERSDERVGTTPAESTSDGPDAGAAADPQPSAQGAPQDPPPAADAVATELQGLRDRYMRLAAEYDNYRKRTDKERAESWGRAQAQLVQQLLDPLDDLQRVAHFNADTVSTKSLLDGVQMVERKLLRLLESAGLEVLDASGQPFDPSIHEAIMASPADRHEDDESVGEVFQKGYRFKGDLLRPARVQVRKFEG
jgi:molecular chaperone GrpE